MQTKLTALIVGISKYPNGAELKNPVNDADDIECALDKLGFSTIKLTDARNEDIERVLNTFKDALNSNSVGLFYFAGHGMQIKGENYLNTIDTNFVDEISAKHSSFPLNQIIETMDSCSNSTNIIILDACRNNPFTRAWNRGPEQSGLASVYTPRGTLIGFATSPGEVAKDGAVRNGTYTESVLKHINTQDLSIESLFKRVRNTLHTVTSGDQTSWEHTSLSGDFFFNISLGRSVSIYKPESIADSLYPIKAGDVIDDIIVDLKSSHWYTQNPAIERMTAKIVNASDIDSLFVLGRNIYQSACGGSNSAVNFIQDIRSKLSGVTKEKSKCILDGMLFEIFFNSDGEIRQDFKDAKFNVLFSLKALPEFSDSFEFIAETTMRYQHRFYVIPGKTHSVSVDIIETKNEDDEHLISEICFEGHNIIRKEDKNDQYDWGMKPIKFSSLRRRLSKEMVIPENQLRVVSSLAEGDRILYPYGVSVAK